MVQSAKQDKENSAVLTVQEFRFTKLESFERNLAQLCGEIEDQYPEQRLSAAARQTMDTATSSQISLKIKTE